MVTTLSDTCKGIVPCPVIPARSRHVLLLFSSSAPLVGLQPASSLIYLWGMSHTCVPFARPCTPKASARGEAPSHSWHRGFGHSPPRASSALCCASQPCSSQLLETSDCWWSHRRERAGPRNTGESRESENPKRGRGRRRFCWAVPGSSLSSTGGLMWG